MDSDKKASYVENEFVGHRKRLRERFSKNGISGLHEHEMLEFLLTYAISRRDVKPLAKKLLKVIAGINLVLGGIILLLILMLFNKGLLNFSSAIFLGVANF